MADMSVEQIAMRADELTDESLESTRRMRMMAEETRETGGKTMVMLDEQGEQLKRAEEGMDQINQDMRQAEKNLKDLSKCCGLCVCPCDRRGFYDDYKRVTSIEKDSRYKRTWGIGGEGGGGGRGSVVSRQPSGVRNGGAAQTQAPPPSGPYVKRITNDAREDEMEENLGAVGDIIGNLKTMAMDMGGELDKQNKQIDRLTDKVSLVWPLPPSLHPPSLLPLSFRSSFGSPFIIHFLFLLLSISRSLSFFLVFFLSFFLLLSLLL
uniref:Synaptosomal-associated protein n=1 Tax=Gadus morhua TaxID=8049 RepID=A0A8C5FTS1_GADMO